MEMVIDQYLQTCVDICQQLVEQLNEHKENTALAVSGEIFEQYEGFVCRANELTYALQEELKAIQQSNQL